MLLLVVPIIVPVVVLVVSRVIPAVVIVVAPVMDVEVVVPVGLPMERVVVIIVAESGGRAPVPVGETDAISDGMPDDNVIVGGDSPDVDIVDELPVRLRAVELSAK